MFRPLLLLNSLGLALGGTILWDGRFNDMTSSSELDDWSWSDRMFKAHTRYHFSLYELWEPGDSEAVNGTKQFAAFLGSLDGSLPELPSYFPMFYNTNPP